MSLTASMIGKENREAIAFLKRAVEYCKLDKSFVSNEAIASAIVESVPQSDAVNIVEQMEEMLQGKYGETKNT